MQQNGAAIMAGDKNAMAQLAGFDPKLAMGLMGDRSSMDNDSRRTDIASRSADASIAASQASISDSAARLKLAQEEGDREMKVFAQGASTRELAETTAHLQTILLQGKQAMTDPVKWSEFVKSNEIDDDIPIERAEEELMRISGALGIKPEAPIEVTAGSTLVDPSTLQPRFTAPEAEPKAPSSVLEYNFAVKQAEEAGMPPPAPYSQWLLETKKAGASSISLNAASEKQESNAAIGSDVILNSASLAADLAGPLSTGLVGAAASYNPASNAAELYRQVGVLKSNATVAALTAMRAASPTGAGMGSVSDKEGEMLAAKAGSLDPKSNRFEAQLADYVQTLLRTVHGFENGTRVFEQWKATRKGAGGGDDGAPAVPGPAKRLKYNPVTDALE
jgi:hypothetical protein